MPANDLTRTEYERHVRAYDWFNARLFAGQLPACVITLQRHRGARGYYWHGKFRRRRGKTEVAEIALNPDTFRGRTDRDILSTLVHEMVHLWQAAFGVPSPGRYHNRQWAEKMRDVGLAPSRTGWPGGAETGERMSHYALPQGGFALAYRELRGTGFRLAWESAPAGRDSSRNKCKFSCPGCGLNVWGADSVDGRLQCNRCDLPLARSA